MRAALYEFREPIDTLLGRAEALVVEDKTAESKAKRWGIVAVVCGLGGLFGIPVIALLSVLVPHLGTVVWLGLAAGFVAGLVLWLKNRVHNLDDRKVNTLVQVARVLKADLPSTAPVHVRIDFRPAAKGGTAVESTGGRFASVKSARYHHPWFRLRAPLADGSVVDLQIADDVKIKSKSKRKYTKVREQTRSEAQVALRLAKRYGDPAGLAERLLHGTPPPTLTVQRVAARGRNLVAALRTPVGTKTSGRSSSSANLELLADGNTLLRCLRWCYRGLRPLQPTA